MRDFTLFSRYACVVCAYASSVVLTSGCSTTDNTFQVIVGASVFKSDVRPCADYASSLNYMGTPYYVLNPGAAKAITRHEGMDFCESAGSEVIASANGTVVEVVSDNPYRGGRVTIRTRLQYEQNGRTETLYVDALHIDPKDDIKVGDVVTAGQLIGRVQFPGKPEIGPRAHVHLSVGPIQQTWTLHTDPNRFWKKGPGNVSCFDPKSPPSDSQLTAPIKC